ncbi:hypothetical protein ACN27G_05970 [Plantactinospora sp. WMMB334]|uniref:hypothetical protein n=1 Tax=Plantactinospora sp. WMMB334 TaxID=3404119 RepID=UPI003B943F48
MGLPIQAGAVAYPSRLNGLATIGRHKAADTALAVSSTTLQDDPDLRITVPASSVWIMDAVIFYSAESNADLSIGFDVPSGATLTWASWGFHTDIASTHTGPIKIEGRTAAQTNSIGASGGSAPLTIRPTGLLVVSTAAGDLQFMAAQNSSQASAATIRAGSWLRLDRVA